MSFAPVLGFGAVDFPADPTRREAAALKLIDQPKGLDSLGGREVPEDIAIQVVDAVVVLAREASMIACEDVFTRRCGTDEVRSEEQACEEKTRKSVCHRRLFKVQSQGLGVAGRAGEIVGCVVSFLVPGADSCLRLRWQGVGAV